MSKGNYYVYILTNWSDAVLYVGMTNDLERRIFEHRSGTVSGFTQKYHVTKLVYYEHTFDVTAAIAREKELKDWRRELKDRLVETVNPDWKDLYDTIQADPSAPLRDDSKGIPIFALKETAAPLLSSRSAAEGSAASPGLQSITVQSYPDWRRHARNLLARQVPPDGIHWLDSEQGQAGLFADTTAPPPAGPPVTVPKAFLPFAEKIACHTDPERWAMLYQALWRITHGEKHLFELQTDPLIHRLELMEQAVRRDAHKTKAFVRFRLVQEEDGEHYIAWHRPDYRVLPLVAPFFQRRFASMRWTILTPDQSVGWDGEELAYGPGVPASEAPQDDALEDVWRTYYRSIFNPARIKLKMMRKEMPVRHWATLPETSIIPEMLAEAEQRIAAMVKYTEGFDTSAEDFLPEDDGNLEALRDASRTCEGCPLYKDATQTVFGEGSASAEYVLVGEQPGDEEDKQGHPFVGPAGQMLDKALEEAGIERGDVYITNAVKHFKFDRQANGRRKHVTPKIREIKACKPWLDHEIKALKPKAIVCLGATAGRSVLGPGFTLKDYRERWHEGPEGSKVLATYHPAAILRAPDHTQREALYRALVQDLKMLRKG